jgi:hypothetical protein
VAEGKPTNGGSAEAPAGATEVRRDQAGEQALHQVVSKQRPARMVGLFTMRSMRPHEVERLVGVCLTAMREEDQGARLTLVPLGDPTPAELEFQRTWRLTVVEYTDAAPHDCLVQLFDIEDPASSHPAFLERIASRDEELGEQAHAALQGAQTFLTVTSGRLDDPNRVHPFENLVSLFSSALGAAIVDPVAFMVTRDPGEWAEALETSLYLETQMASVGKRPPRAS